MTFEIENVYPEVVLPDYETVIKNVIEAALDYEKCPYEAQVYVLLTDNEEIHEINKEHRQIDRPTDVLSFPMADYPVPGDFSDIEERDPDAFHPETGELILGESKGTGESLRSFQYKRAGIFSCTQYASPYGI